MNDARVLKVTQAELAAHVTTADETHSVFSSDLKPLVITLGGGSPFEQVLPDGGLPRGAVVEVASVRALGRTTSFALAACRAAQEEAAQRLSENHSSYCAFVDPWSTLHAPAVVQRGVDPTRLLVVRPSLDELARVVVKMAERKVFSMIVVDLAAPPGACTGLDREVRLDRWGPVVRRLALAVERSATTVLLLTDRLAPRSMPLPVSLKIEFSSISSDRWAARIAKDRYGRVRGPVAIAS